MHLHSCFDFLIISTNIQKPVLYNHIPACSRVHMQYRLNLFLKQLIECSLKNLEDIQAMVQSQKKLLVKEYEKMGLAKNKIKSKHTTTEARPKVCIEFF